MAKAKAAAARHKRAIRRVAAKPVKGKGAKPRSFKKSVKNAQRPIELYYWPTPNGYKISIMLEECALPYVLKPVNINTGEQFAPAFLKIAPNNRMPAIIDPDGPGGKPISVFESGAILQYLGRKTGKFYPQDERRRVIVEEWLFWQMAGLGPMTGQANHFYNYVKEPQDYARKRYSDEVHRLQRVMNTRLATRKYLADNYSIADMACWGWVVSGARHHPLDEFPHLIAWKERLDARPAVQRGFALGQALRAAQPTDPKSDEERRKILFGQR
jgi:GSH-dependent disulfide-bond oxidoreductase